jgi:hypothetical protein
LVVHRSDQCDVELDADARCCLQCSQARWLEAGQRPGDRGARVPDGGRAQYLAQLQRIAAEPLREEAHVVVGHIA